MKYSIALFAVLFIFSCKESNPADHVEQSPKAESNFEWLLGNWKRINEKAGKYTFERWEKKSKYSYLGYGFTMEKSDTTWGETMLLNKLENEWQIKINQNNDGKATIFRLTNITETSFICENPKNDFPKVIEYKINDDTLKANISGGGPEINFLFVKN